MSEQVSQSRHANHGLALLPLIRIMVSCTDKLRVSALRSAKRAPLPGALRSRGNYQHKHSIISVTQLSCPWRSKAPCKRTGGVEVEHLAFLTWVAHYVFCYVSNTLKTLAEECEWNEPRLRPECRWDDNIKIVFEEILVWCVSYGVDWELLWTVMVLEFQKRRGIYWPAVTIISPIKVGL